MNPVLQMLEGGEWRVVQATLLDGNIALIRYRTPILGGTEVPGYPWRLVVLWSYAEEGTGALPSPEATEEMDVFEERICEAFGHDAHAVWVAGVTFDGARRWVFYTGDVEECGRRLAAMPQEEEPYPIEMEAEEDPKWLYLREQILGDTDSDA